MLLTLIQTLVPEGTLRQAASFTGGLVLLAALLGPVLDLDLTGMEGGFSRWREEVAQRQEELLEAQESELSARIAAETEAYISDKGEELGLRVTARVETRDGRGRRAGALVRGPDGAAVRGAGGVPGGGPGHPAERQVWHEREAEN